MQCKVILMEHFPQQSFKAYESLYYTDLNNLVPGHANVLDIIEWSGHHGQIISALICSEQSSNLHSQAVYNYCLTA